jgi:hypothetical protein
MEKLNRFLSAVSGEFFLDWRANGGVVVFLRALWTSLCVYIPTIFLKEVIRPGHLWEPDCDAFRRAVVDTIPWFGAIFAVTYAALYTRFASQWAYLAGLYNEIMTAQVRNPPNLASESYYYAWKAGFIEDAETLHLATKPMFASVVQGMLQNNEIRAAYVAHTIGGEARLTELERQINTALQQESTRRTLALPSMPGSKSLTQ